MTYRSLPLFFVITFGVAWGILGAFIFLPDAMQALFGPLTGTHPLFVLAVYAPAMAAFIIVALWGGIPALRRFLTRLLLWRCPLPWAVFLVIGIPLIFAAGSLVKGNLEESFAALPALIALLGAMLFTLVLGPVEEFGWRGVVLPIFQRHMVPFWAGLILGVIWGLWHLPAFFLSGTPQGAWGFAPFFVGSVAISLILTPLFNVSGGSILLAALFHFQLNNPLWPDAQPYDTVFFAMVAVLVVWLNRRMMFSRSHCVTEVVPAR
ncbi:MAG: CPBP family intramembrane glutamic endopeptidase [Hyphomicrobiales bacterium]|jgi:membrane protease YdiL (CAAX protease family)